MACSRMPKWKLRPPELSGREVAGAVEGQPRLGRGGQVGRAADQPGHVLGRRRSAPCRRRRGWPGPWRRPGRSAGRCPSRRAAGGAACGRAGRPARGTASGTPRSGAIQACAQLPAALADAVAEVLADAVGHEELGVLRPAVVPLGQPDLLLAERLAVGGAGVLLVGRAVGDVAVDDDQRRAGRACLLKMRKARVEHVEVVGVADAGDVPAVADEARGHVLAEGQRGVALDGDVVVVVDPAQVGELAGGRRARRPRPRCLPSCSRRRTGRRRCSRTARSRAG